MTEQYVDDARVRHAALVAYAFHIDPIAVLDSDYHTWAIRSAAYEALQQEIEKARPKKG